MPKRIYLTAPRGVTLGKRVRREVARPRHGSNHEGEREGVRGALDPAYTRRNYATPAYPLLIYRHQVHTESWVNPGPAVLLGRFVINPYLLAFIADPVRPDFNPLIKSSGKKSREKLFLV